MTMRRKQDGFSYLIVLFAVAVLSLVSLRAMENSLTRERRMKEAELLLVGQYYRNAIRSYYENSGGSIKDYPPDLNALLSDTRTTTLRRYLRKLYWDPVTGGAWGIVKNEQDKVIGVYSLSPQQPIKKGGFSVELASFTNARTYQDWKFVYQPN